MGYTIIFETKFVKLSDGRLLHLARSGCNNDDAGRSLDEFSGKIYTLEAITEYANNFMKDGKPNKDYGFELKIGNKHATYYEYGEHLLRMAKRAVSYNDFIAERHFYASRYDGVELIEPEKRIMTPKEFDDYWYNNRVSMRYRRLTTKLNSEVDIIKALENKESVSFYVGKKYKINKIV